MLVAATWILAAPSASGGPVSSYVYPFLGVMLALILVVGYVQRRKNRSDDEEN